MRILVTGGTGTLGTVVVAQLNDAGHEVRVLSRRPRPAAEAGGASWCVGDLRKGTGIQQAVAGVDTVVHCATGRGDFMAGRNLVDACRVDRPHLVYMSIVGIDDIPMSYYRRKLQVEQGIQASGLPWTILRATQFHNLVAGLFSAQRHLPVLLVPAGFAFQPIDVRDVAARLVQHAVADPAGRVPDVGGPQSLAVQELAAVYLRSARHRRKVLRVRLPGATAAAFRRGANLTTNTVDDGVTFERFLIDRTTGRASGPAR